MHIVSACWDFIFLLLKKSPPSQDSLEIRDDKDESKMIFEEMRISDMNLSNKPEQKLNYTKSGIAICDLNLTIQFSGLFSQ